MKHVSNILTASIVAAAAFAGCADGEEQTPIDDENVGEVESELFGLGVPKPGSARFNSGSDSLHLDNEVRFLALQPNVDPVNGREKFGLAADLQNEDNSNALFEGFSIAAGGQPIVSNQRSCFTCHRGENVGLGLPVPPLSNHIALTDTLFTQVDADAQGDPDGFTNLENFALIKIRPNRFNPRLSQSDPLRKVFFWRKSPRLVNLAFSHGFLNDGRGRNTFETIRGAIFSHTQELDDRFDDLIDPNDVRDMEAFMFEQVSDPVLLALRDPNHPDHQKLVDDPFYTVPIQTTKQYLGSRIFKRKCMSCHSTPNVFNSLANTNPVGARNTDENPAFGPGQAGAFLNIGVAEANKHNLRFSVEDGNGGFETVVVSLADADGGINQFPVTFDIGLAATTRRTNDVGKFKVPQLRNVANNAPYFHDNSAMTLEEALDYHLSSDYASSPAGSKDPIFMTNKQRERLLAFLQIL